MREKIAELIFSLAQNFIYDITNEACRSFIKKYKRDSFLKKLHKKIQEYCITNDSLYFGGDTFSDYLDNYKPIDRIMQNAIAINNVMTIDELTRVIIDEAEKHAKSRDKYILADDKNAIKGLCLLVHNEMVSFYNSSLDDGQRYIVSKAALNTYEIKKEIHAIDENIGRKTESIEKLIREATSLSDYKAEPLAEMICKKMWGGQFDEVETICNLAAEKSEDINLLIRVLKKEMRDNTRENDDAYLDIKSIKNSVIRDTAVRNILPLVFFREERMELLQESITSEYLGAIVAALRNKDYSYIYSETRTKENGIEVRKYSLNEKLLEAEEWLSKQVLAISLYKMNQVSSAAALESVLDASTSWFSMLILFDQKIDAIAFAGEGPDFRDKVLSIKKKLECKKTVFDGLSNDIRAVYYSLIIKASLILEEENSDDLLKTIPVEIQVLNPAREFIYAIRIKNNNVSFDELYSFCKDNNSYWLMANYVVSNRDDGILAVIEEHIDLIRISPQVFFIYIEGLIHNNRKDEALRVLNENRDIFQKYFEYWNSYLKVDNSDKVRNQFIELCRNDGLIYVNGHSACLLIERLLNFEEYDLAEKYNNQLSFHKSYLDNVKKYQAYILAGRGRLVDALKLFKESYEVFCDDNSILQEILVISIKIKRRIDVKYIQEAERKDNPQLVVLAAGAYATNGNYIDAHRCNRYALFLNDDCHNPAFNQFLGLYAKDKREDVKEYHAVEKNTVVMIRADSGETIRYCIHEDKELPSSPCTWNGDIHIYVNDAASLNIYRKQLNDKVIIGENTYKIIHIEALDSYISRVCFEKVVRNGTAKAIVSTVKEGKIDMESFAAQFAEYTSDAKDRVDWISQYNNFDDVALPIFSIKKFYGATYSQFVEMIIEEPKSCIRELEFECKNKNNRYILSFTSFMLLKKIGVSTTFINENNAYITESTLIQVREDSSEIISRYAQDTVASMGLYEGKVFTVEDNEDTKQKWIKEAGDLYNYAEKINTVVSSKDWKRSEFDNIDMPDIIGIPDYDAISLGQNENYTLIGTESMVVGLAMNESIAADVISITDWLLKTSDEIFFVLNCVKNLIQIGCIYAVTPNLVLYLIDIIDKDAEDEAEQLLKTWDDLLNTYEFLNDNYKPYGLESLRKTYISVIEQFDKSIHNAVLQAMLHRLLSLYRIRVSARLNDKGELEMAYFQEEL